MNPYAPTLIDHYNRASLVYRLGELNDLLVPLGGTIKGDPGTDGQVTVWDSNGKMTFQCTYEDGKMSGDCYCWSRYSGSWTSTHEKGVQTSYSM